MNMDEWGIAFYLIAILAMVLIGVSKAGVPGLGILVVPLMAIIFDSKLSVGILLPMLIVADICAVLIYRKSAQWNKILHLFPSVAIGMIVAGFAYYYISKEDFTPILGILILAMLLLDFLKKKYKWEKLPDNKGYIFLVGFLAGFATMLGNAAGPIMSIYLLSCGLEKKEFMGTGAWYFLIINSLKVPYFIVAGSITMNSFVFNLKMIPLILFGVWLGMAIFKKLNQKVFQIIVLSLAFLSAILLFFK
jgi:uncharacterized membrane protein YfcA